MMLPKKVKRCFGLLLSIITVFSLSPVSALATEGTYIPEEENSINTSDAVPTIEVTPVAETTSEETVIVEQSVLDAYQTEINRILTEYLGTAELTAEQAAQGVASLNERDTYNAHWEVLIVEDDLMMDYDAGILSEEEINALLDVNAAFCAFATEVHENTPEDDGTSTYGNITLLDGILYVYDTKSTLSKTDEDTFSVTAKGSLISKTTNTIKFRNDSGKTAKLTVKYSVSSANAFTIAGSTAATSGTYVNEELAASGEVVFSLTSNSGFSGTTATLTVSEVSLVPVGQSANFTYTFENTKGSVKVGSTAVTSGTPVAMKSGDIVTATPTTGYEFVGWLNTTDNTLISTDTSYEFAVDGDLAVTALFEAVNGTPWFYVKENKGVYNSLSAATGSANAATIVLINNGKLPSGNHTVPNGKTLLIPYDKGFTVVTTSPSVITSTTKPSAYRTLTMASGAKLIVNGSLSVAGTLVANQTYGYNGQPVGPVGHIKMESGSTIEANGSMYVLGYIYGSGSVVVNSGATVYECFQIRDFRGGSATSSMKYASEKVFPLSQYYVQNIEVPMTLYSGAFCKGISAFNINSKFQTPDVPFIGNNSDYLFQLTSGNLVKDYDESNDRLEVLVNGTLSLTSFTISLPGLASMGDIDTGNYILPINSNITVEITESNNLKIDQNIQLLPEAELIIDEGATCSIGSDKKVIVYDSDNWGAYCGEKHASNNDDVPVKPLLWVAEGKAPSVDRFKASAANMHDAKLQINGIFDASAGSLYTTAGGGNITSNGTGILKLGTAPSALTTYQATQNGSDISYASITASAAQLKHGDGTYLQSKANTYTYQNGRWVCETHTFENDGGNGSCTVCHIQEVTFEVLHNLNLKDLIQIGYWVNAQSAGAEIQEVGILIWEEDEYPANEADRTVDSITAYKPEMTARSVYRQGYGEGIFAQFLDTNYYAIPYVLLADGRYVYGETDVYAAPIYATQMDEQSDKVKTVVYDLLNYGTYARFYFDSRKGNELGTPINNGIPSVKKANRFDSSMLVSQLEGYKDTAKTLDCTWLYSTADLMEAIQLNYFAEESSTFTNMLYWNETAYSTATALTVDTAAASLDIEPRTMGQTQTSMARIGGIYAKNISDWQYACMYNSADGTYGPLRVDSVAGYLSRMINAYKTYEGQETTNGYLVETCKAMLAYGDSAKAYANS